jgi:hypothetical protein
MSAPVIGVLAFDPRMRPLASNGQTQPGRTRHDLVNRPGRYHRLKMVFRFKVRGEENWQHLGTFDDDPEQLIALRALLEHCDDPLTVLDRVKAVNQMAFDILDICRLEHHAVRVLFTD